jgi:hypothetical protein
MCDHDSYCGPITWQLAQKSGDSDLASSFGGPNIRKTITAAPAMHPRAITLATVQALILFIVFASFLKTISMSIGAHIVAKN